MEETILLFILEENMIYEKKLHHSIFEMIMDIEQENNSNIVDISK